MLNLASQLFVTPVCIVTNAMSLTKSKLEPGQTCGRLLVIGPTAERQSGHVVWTCRCSCGMEMAVPRYVLTRKIAIKSCNICSAASRRLALGEASLNALIGTYKSNASRRGLTYSLSAASAKAIFSFICHYCGHPPSQTLNQTGKERRYGEFVYNGIDRKDNLIGYLPDNCVACCKICNRAKLDMPYTEFLIWIQQMRAYNSQYERKETTGSSSI